MKKIFLSSIFFLISPLSALASATHPLSTIVTPEQSNDIVNSLLKAVAPSGASVDNISINGTYSVDDNNILTQVDLSQVNFHVTYLSFIKDSATVTLTASIPNGDCNTPQITNVRNIGTNSMVDNEITKYLKNHAADVMKDFVIKKSNLVNLCKVKPKMDLNNFNDNQDNENKIDYKVMFY